MSDEREDELWDRLYNMDGFGLSDYMEQLYPFTDSSMRWGASQRGEELYARCDDGIVFSWCSWHVWREKVSYYFSGFRDSLGADMDEERFLNIAIYYLAEIVLSSMLKLFAEDIQPVDIQCKLILF